MIRRKGNLLMAVIVFAFLASMSVTMLLSANVTRKAASKRSSEAMYIYSMQCCTSMAAQQLYHDLDSLSASSPYNPVYLSTEDYQNTVTTIYQRLFDGDGKYVVEDMRAVIDYAGIKEDDIRGMLQSVARNTSFALRAETKLILNYADPDNILAFAGGDRIALEEFVFNLTFEKGNRIVEQTYQITGLYATAEHGDTTYEIRIHNDEADCQLLTQNLK